MHTREHRFNVPILYIYINMYVCIKFTACGSTECLNVCGNGGGVLVV